MTVQIVVRHDDPDVPRAVLVTRVTGRPGDTGVVLQPLAAIWPGDQLTLVVYPGMYLALSEQDPAADAAPPPAAPVAASEAA